jgi:hypothetical protein
MMRAAGEMPEWPNGTDSKSVEQATVPRVQIPISPPLIKDKPLKFIEFRGLFRFGPTKCRRSVDFGLSEEELMVFLSLHS